MTLKLDKLDAAVYVARYTRLYERLIEKVLTGPNPDPSLYRLARRLAPPAARTSIALGLLGAVTCIISPYACILALTPVLTPVLAYIAGLTWRSMLSSGIDKEIPQLLAYLLPYTHTPRYIADLLSTLPPSLFKWSRRESERLALMLAKGEDPLTALKRLAETTPSRRLSRILSDYIAAQSLGAPRSQVTLALLSHALATIRDSWRRYTEIGRVASEAVITAVIAVAALTPITLLSGGDLALLAPIAILAPLAGSAVLLMSRPSMGEPRPPAYIIAISLGAPVASSILAYSGMYIEAILILAAAVAPVEYYWAKVSNSIQEAARSLRLAADAARYRGNYDEYLSRARTAAGPLVEALVESMTVAGKLGVANALQAIAQVMEEAVSSLRGTRATSILLSSLAVSSILVGVYTSILVGEAAREAGLASVEGPFRVLMATAPLAPLPAAVMYRGLVPSLIPSLASLLGAYLLHGMLL